MTAADDHPQADVDIEEGDIEPLPGYIDPEYGRAMARAQRRAVAEVARIRAEIADHPRVVMRRCPRCGEVIGPREENRGRSYCSAPCAEAARKWRELEDRRRSYEAWLDYRHRGTYSVG